MALEVVEFQELIQTHVLTPVGPMPPVLDPDSVYPYQSYHETSTRPILKRYHFIKLENDFVEAWICPDLGGKVYSLKHKPSDKECLYVPDVIRHTRILPRFNFVAGGIEVSFPISHTPSQNEKVLHSIRKEKDRIYVSVGETELHYGMQWTVEFSLGENDTFLTQRTLFRNPTNNAHPWMSWSNAAVPAFPDSEFQFPNGEVLLHSDELKTIDWEADGPKTNKEIAHMSGYFWKSPDIQAFGCYTPSIGTGLYHVASKEKVPGIKLWSYGEGRDKEWSYLSTRNKQSYLEIQAGPISDQSMKKMLEPGASTCHVEFWIPVASKLEIEHIELPDISLRTENEIPLFSYARKHEIQVWERLNVAYKEKNVTQIPEPPPIESSIWPPSGLPELEDAFKWSVENDSTDHKSLWQLYRGVWLIACGKIDEALPILMASEHDLSRAVLSRLYVQKGEYREARNQLSLMTDSALQLHPQIVVERDKVLEFFSKETFDERAEWLNALNALDDEMVLERNVALLIDMGNYKEAKRLLLGTKFQKMHQRYERKALWKKLCKKTDTTFKPYPENLGEDNLAVFGAYRTY